MKLCRNSDLSKTFFPIIETNSFNDSPSIEVIQLGPSGCLYGLLAYSPQPTADATGVTLVDVMFVFIQGVRC